MKEYKVVPFEPYSWQSYFYDNCSKYNVLVKDRQAGKTEVGVELGLSIIHSPKVSYPKWAIASDEIGRCFRAYGSRLNKAFRGHEHFHWSNAKQSSFRIPRKEGDYISIDVFGSRANFFGAKGGTYHYFLCDEYGQVGEGYFEEVMSPTVRKTDGIVLVTGTVEDNWWYDLFQFGKSSYEAGDPHWFAFESCWGDKWSKADFSEEELLSVRAAFDLSNEEKLRQWEKEYLCNWFSASRGKIFSRTYQNLYKAGHIGHFPYNPKYKVGFAIDNGRTSSVWFYQIIKGRIFLVDYLELVEYGFDELAKKIRGWYKDRGAELDLVLFPHTMEHKHQSANMKSNATVFCEFWNISEYVRVVPRVAVLETKIDSLRRMLSNCYFNGVTTQVGLRSLRNYKRVYQRAKGYLTDRRDEQWTHGVDALGELALSLDNGIFDDSLDRRVQKLSVVKDEVDMQDRMLKKFEKMETRTIKIPKGYLGGY